MLRPAQALALALVGIVLALLTYGAWWRFALFALFFTGVAFALFFRALSGTAAGSNQRSSELAWSALKKVALTVALMMFIVVAVFLASR